MPEAWNDGSIPFGSVTLTINSVAYIAESYTPTRPTAVIERRNAVNEPSGSVGVADFVTGSAVLQKAATSTAMPTPGMTFQHTEDSTVGAETFYITEVSQAKSQGEATKFNISFRKKYN